jgi:hypothetical protein
LFPHKLIEVILAYGPVSAFAAIGIAVIIRAETTIIVEFSLGCLCGGPVKGIAAFTANQ